MADYYNRVDVYHREAGSTTFTLVIFRGRKHAYYFSPSHQMRPRRMSYDVATAMVRNANNGFRPLHGNNRIARHCLYEIAMKETPERFTNYAAIASEHKGAK